EPPAPGCSASAFGLVLGRVSGLGRGVLPANLDLELASLPTLLDRVLDLDGDLDALRDGDGRLLPGLLEDQLPGSDALGERLEEVCELLTGLGVLGLDELRLRHTGLLPKGGR